MPAKKPIKPAAIIILVVIALFLVIAVFGASSVAEWLYEVEEPTRRQIRSARVMILAPITLPFLFLLGWMFWNDRRAHRIARERALRAPRLEDPSRVHRLDSVSDRVD